jgi:O-antigen/teichoic acid export membrane protein
MADTPPQEPEPEDVRSNEDLTQATAEGLRWITYTRIAVELVLLASMVVLARLIPPSAFGIFAVVVIVQELAFTMPSEGVGSAIVQRRSVERKHLQGGLMLGLLMALVMAAVALAAAGLVARPVYGDETAYLLMLATPCFLLGAVSAVPVAVLRRRLDFARLSIIDVASTFTRMSVTVALAFLGLDASALVLGHLVSTVVGAALAWMFAPVPLPRWNRDAVRDLLPYGGPATLACIAWTGFRNGDYAIIGARLGPAQAGFYWRAYQLAVEYQRKISSIMSQMAFPVLARTAGAAEMLALRRRMVQVLTTVLFPLLVLLALLAPTVIPWLFGSTWEPAVLPTQILALGGASTLVIDAVGPALMAAGRAKALLGYGVGHFVVYAGAVIAVSSRGLSAVAIAATVVHTIFLVIAYQVMLGGHLGRALRFLWHDVAAATVCCLALAAAGVAVQWAARGAELPAPLHIAAVALAGALAYLVALRAAFPSAWGDVLAVARRVVPARALLLRERLPRPLIARARRASPPA